MDRQTDRQCSLLGIMGDKQVKVGNRGKIRQVSAVGLLGDEETLGYQ